MKVHNLNSTAEDSHLTVEKKDVNYTLKPEKLSDMQFVESKNIEKIHQTIKFGIVSELFNAFVMTLTGLGLFKVTGLYDGMNSTIGRMGLGSLIACYFWVMFRHGLYSSQLRKSRKVCTVIDSPEK